jgi:uncharacterized membrane protein
MIILYMFASLFGALTTFTVLSSHGSMVALLCAPMGGGALGLVVAVLVVWSERATTLPPEPGYPSIPM